MVRSLGMAASKDSMPSASELLSGGVRGDIVRIRAGYGDGTRNDLRTQERSEALELHKSVGTVVPMDDVEFSFHLNAAVECMVGGGASEVEDYGAQRGFSPEDVKRLCQLAVLKIQQLQDRDLDHSQALARARYEDLFRSTQKLDPRTAMRAQMNLDRVNGVGQARDGGDTLRSMLDIIRSVARGDEQVFEQDAEDAEFAEVESYPEED